MQHWKEACAAGGTDFLYDRDGNDDDNYDHNHDGNEEHDHHYHVSDGKYDQSLIIDHIRLKTLRRFGNLYDIGNLGFVKMQEFSFSIQNI